MAVCSARALSLLGLVLVGCSGAGNSDLFEGTSDQNATSATEPAPSATTPSTPSTPSGVPNAGAPAPSPSPDPGAPDGGVEPPPPPPPTCTPEAEPNNDINHATTFTASLCGAIDGTSDVDFARFVIPAGATNVTLTHAEKGGKVTYRYYLNGLLVPVLGDGLMPVPGAVYSVQIKLAPGSDTVERPTYRLDVSFGRK